MSSQVELEETQTNEPEVWPAMQRCDSVFGEDPVYRAVATQRKRQLRQANEERSASGAKTV